DYDALLFTAHSLPRPISWLGSHTDNVACTPCACFHGFAFLRDNIRKAFEGDKENTDRAGCQFQHITSPAFEREFIIAIEAKKMAAHEADKIYLSLHLRLSFSASFRGS
nr:hypothetical protein [Tanacetum cinerariifolium]